jgi:chromosome segregation ATPase
MPDENLTSMNYEAECNRLAKINERLKMEIDSLENERIGLKNTLSDAEKEIAFLKGQIEAFRFCVAKGGVNNGKV